MAHRRRTRATLCARHLRSSPRGGSRRAARPAVRDGGTSSEGSGVTRWPPARVSFSTSWDVRLALVPRHVRGVCRHPGQDDHFVRVRSTREELCGRRGRARHHPDRVIWSRRLSCSAAIRASSRRELMSSLAKMLRRWLETVCGETNSCSATSRLVRPRATRRATGELGVGHRRPAVLGALARDEASADAVVAEAASHAATRPRWPGLRVQDQGAVERLDRGASTAPARARATPRSSSA
jgi:hypothetical protein